MQTIQREKLFITSCIALVATAMTFAIRAGTIKIVGEKFSIPAFEMGVVTGTAFWGFAISIVIGGSICDMVGMKKLLIFSFLGHLTGIVMTLFATGFWSLFFSTLLIGLANGFVEAACNPLVATIYADRKTQKLNQFHVWFPGGIVIGGLTSFGLQEAKINWQWQVATILIPTLVYGLLAFRATFPKTERVNSGVSTKEMLKECVRPLFILMLLCMFLTAFTELGTNQYIEFVLQNAGVAPILLLVFVSGLMVLGRSYAHKVEPLLSPAGMLLFSAIFSATGLFLLGISTGYWSFLSAAVFALGVCYFWPTMLGFVSEYLPKTGALGLSLIGAGGMFFVGVALPYLADFYKNQTYRFTTIGVSEEVALKNTGVSYEATLKNAELAAGASTLHHMALLPLTLTVVFAILYFRQHKLNHSHAQLQ